MDLFSGIGGLSLALEPWVRTVAYCEQDRYAQAVLLSRMHDGLLHRAPIWDDVRTLDSTSLSEMLAWNEEVEDMAGKLKKLTEEQVRQAVESYNAGMSLADLAHVFGVSRQALWDLLRRRTKMRPQKRTKEENHFYRGGKRSDKRAHDVMERAIKSGQLVNPGICESCNFSGQFADGRNAIQGHHDDYNKPLSVRWLCQRCHHEWHKHNQPVPAREGGGEEASAIDIIFGGFP